MTETTKTDKYIRMLKADDYNGLNIFYDWRDCVDNVDFTRVYAEVKDVHNSSVYYALGSFIYMYGYGDLEIDEAMGIYYLLKSARTDNQLATSKIKEMHDIGCYYDRIGNFCELIDKYIDLEENHEEILEKNKQLEERVRQLEIELRYRPEGEGYVEALADFNKRIYKN